MAFFNVKDLCKGYGQYKVLKNISFDVEEGETISILGQSGCGKTTLLRCLSFLDRADDGLIVLKDKIIFDGSIQKKNDYSIERKNFGFVFQTFELFPQYTSFQNVYLPLSLQVKKETGTLTKDQKEKINIEVNNILDSVGLLDKANNYPWQLSGGQKQRVAIARAIALKPSILCLDEPTSALDPSLKNEVFKLIMDLKEKNRMTMLMVTHELEFAKKVSDKVMFISNGQIEEFGNALETFDNPKSEMFKEFILA